MIVIGGLSLASFDGSAKPAPGSCRRRSRKKSGKQAGAPGESLAVVAGSDENVTHTPENCEGCGDDVVDAPGTGAVRRQVINLPPTEAMTIELRTQSNRCHYSTETTATFSPEAADPTCSRPNLRAIERYLVVYRHISNERVTQLLADGYGIPGATATIIAMVMQGITKLEAFPASLRDELGNADVVTATETRLRMPISLCWVHSGSDQPFTLNHLDKRRGTLAIVTMCMLANLSDGLIHDRRSPYRKDAEVAQALCNADHLRELNGLAEAAGQKWATDMAAPLAKTWHRVFKLKETGINSMDNAELAPIRSTYKVNTHL